MIHVKPIRVAELGRAYLEANVKFRADQRILHG